MPRLVQLSTGDWVDPATVQHAFVLEGLHLGRDVGGPTTLMVTDRAGRKFNRDYPTAAEADLAREELLARVAAAMTPDARDGPEGGERT